MIFEYLRWVLVAIKNFPHYGYNKKTKVIVFYKTGHALDVSNPYALTPSRLKVFRQIWSRENILSRLFTETTLNKLLLSESVGDRMVTNNDI